MDRVRRRNLDSLTLLENLSGESSTNYLVRLNISHKKDHVVTAMRPVYHFHP